MAEEFKWCSDSKFYALKSSFCCRAFLEFVWFSILPITIHSSPNPFYLRSVQNIGRRFYLAFFASSWLQRISNCSEFLSEFEEERAKNDSLHVNTMKVFFRTTFRRILSSLHDNRLSDQAQSALLKKFCQSEKRSTKFLSSKKLNVILFFASCPDAFQFTNGKVVGG